MKLDWHNEEIARSLVHDKTLSTLLFHAGSLTRFIQDKCDGEFAIELISEGWLLPMPDEAKSLQTKNTAEVYIRESWLKSDNRSLIYARSVVPLDTFELISEKLTALGTRPLGELLFADRIGHRSKMRYSRIQPGCVLHGTATASTNDKSALWARRSLFYIKNKPLLIIEVFLPVIKKCIQD